MKSLSIQQDTRFTSLEEQTQNIIRILLDGNEALRSEIESQFKALNLKEEEGRAEEYKKKVGLSLLASLRFETMTLRHEAIEEAHRRTFEWIFRDPKEEGKPWHNFSQWLESGSGVYWINGKPGSGKSTLMRFIVEENRTHRHLKRWALNGLELPAFFFWNGGAVDQRSQASLFRSILYDMLEKHRDLIPLVFPDEWRKNLENVRVNVQSTFGSWSLLRLKRAFEKLILRTSKHLQFCFFIDGFDEYEGDHEELAEYLLGFSKYPFVKFCISSRPWQVFIKAFGDRPSLRLQDLTRDDIQIYIEDKLKRNKRMINLTDDNPEAAASLVEEVIEKSDGVFLWVVLVIKSLLIGLRDRDNISDLERTLRSLPPDLESLYAHMFCQIRPTHLVEGSKIFQIYQAAVSVHGSISVDQIHVALIVDPLRVLGTATADLEISKTEPVRLSRQASVSGQKESFYDEESLFEFVDMKLRTRCSGLIEIIRYRDLGARLAYIHRTVKDYLEREDVWNQLLKKTESVSETGFDPHMALLMSHILMLKRRKLRPGRKVVYRYQELDEIKGVWKECGGHIRCMKPSNVDIQVKLLNEFDRVATMQFETYAELALLEKSKAIPYRHWSGYGIPNNWMINFLRETIRTGFYIYVKANLAVNTAQLEQKYGMPLLAFAFLAQDDDDAHHQQLEMIQLLLESGADPNETYLGHTLWQYLVHYFHTYPPGRKEDVSHLEKSFRLMLDHGVDLNVCCLKHSDVWEQIYPVGHHDDFSRSIFGDLRKDLAHHGQFEPVHSLVDVIENIFRDSDPNGADELLEHIAKLKEAIQSENQPGPSSKQKNKKRGKRVAKNKKP